MPDVNITPLSLRSSPTTATWCGPAYTCPRAGPFPVVPAASACQKKLRHLPVDNVFSLVEYGPMQLALDHGYAAMDVPGTGRSTGTWDIISCTEGVVKQLGKTSDLAAQLPNLLD